ncbi:hypothetical protein BM221_003960 [Beauveria bassiana]|uniref:Uncharacterized protein n=1 Tax=Beauveria bassiana TaxID=176275 RepID=A0A2N6NPW1_BEABA|nr:hypothetical protein BM221_003960 [Beauveria bassiana]
MEMSWGRRPDPALNKPFTTKSRREGSSEARMGQPRRHCGASQVPQRPVSYNARAEATMRPRSVKYQSAAALTQQYMSDR